MQSRDNKAGMEVTLAVLADFASTSREGKLNIMGIFDQINPTTFPAGLPLMHLVISYEASPAEYDTTKQTKVALLDADGNQIFAAEQAIKVNRPAIPGARATMNQIYALAGVRFEKAGDYQFSVLVNDDQKRSVSLRVNEIPKDAT